MGVCLQAPLQIVNISRRLLPNGFGGVEIKIRNTCYPALNAAMDRSIRAGLPSRQRGTARR